MERRHLLKSAATALILAAAGPAAAQDNTLKIASSASPAARRPPGASPTSARWSPGRDEIGGETCGIEIVTFDDQKDPKRAIAGMERMAQEGIHYVVGPNVDDGAAAVRPVAEQNDIIYFPYSFPKELYAPPTSNAGSSARAPARRLSVVAWIGALPIVLLVDRAHSGARSWTIAAV